MLWTILEIVLAFIGLVTATTLWNQFQEKRRLLVLGCLLIGIIVLSIHSHFEATKNEETIKRLRAETTQNEGTIEKLRAQLGAAEQKIAENDVVRKKVLEYGDMAKLNADGSTGLVKKGGGLRGGETAITPKAEKIWIYSGENNETRHPKCDEEGMEQAKRIIEEHPMFPFSYYALASCQRAKGEREWASYSQRALDILEFTTQVVGHNRHHDTVKRYLETWMKESGHHSVR